MRRAWTGLALVVLVASGCAGAPGETGTSGATSPPAAHASPVPAALGLDGTPDADGDLLSDAQEAELGTSPHARDTDRDGISDPDELVLSLTDPTLRSTDGQVPDGRSDLDGDGLGFLTGRALGTDPLERDTDADGLDDGVEIGAGTDPLVADSDGDGLDDGLEERFGRDPLVAEPDGPVELAVLEGDVTVVASGEAAALADLRATRGSDMRWDGSPVVLAESIDFRELDGVDSLRFEVDLASVGADPAAVGILALDGEGTIVALLEQAEPSASTAAAMLTFTYDVPPGLEYPTFAVIDVPAWRALFD